jgi:hypothetical protein
VVYPATPRPTPCGLDLAFDDLRRAPSLIPIFGDTAAEVAVKPPGLTTVNPVTV